MNNSPNDIPTHLVLTEENSTFTSEENSTFTSEEPTSQRNQNIGFLWLPRFNQAVIDAIKELLDSRSLRLGGTDIGAQYGLILDTFARINLELKRILPQK